MKITSSYRMKLTGDLKALESSIRIYREALRFIIPIVDAHWDEIKNFKYIHQRMARIEKLIHSTKKNQAQYNFDERFLKFPTYLRRAALNCALGIVSSYPSNLANWEKEPKGQIPQLRLTHYTYPAYYKGNLFRNFDPIRQTIELKVFKNGDNTLVKRVGITQDNVIAKNVDPSNAKIAKIEYRPIKGVAPKLFGKQGKPRASEKEGEIRITFESSKDKKLEKLFSE